MHGSDSKAIQSPTQSGRFLILPPPGTLTLCLLTLSGSVAQSIADSGQWTQTVGVVPANVWNLSAYAGIAEGQVIPIWLTLFAYLFLHGGWWHVLSNMTGLWVFGAIAEPVMGTWRFVLTYFLGGIVGALGIGLVLPQSSAAVAGASLAISGLLGAYAALGWSSKRHTRTAEFVVLGLEAVSVIGIAAWLAVRTVPGSADITCSVVYHFIPGLALWLGIRALGGCKRLMESAFDRAEQSVRVAPLSRSPTPGVQTMSRLATAIRSLAAPAVIGAIICGSAGRWDLPFVWAVLGVMATFYLTLAALADPEMLRERAEPKPGNKDRLTQPLAGVLLLGHWLIAGLDIGRFHWSPVPWSIQTVGLVGYAGALAVNFWAMRANRFYSSVVRVQLDRGQVAVDRGPYRFVRHPGYAATLLAMLCGGVALGSWLAILPILGFAAIFIRRTLLEDQLLQLELPGYTAYAQRVRSRLIPGVY